MKRKKLLIPALLLATLMPASGCGKPAVIDRKGTRYSGTVRVSGSTTVLPLAQEAATQFMEKNPKANIQVQGGGSSVGITQIKEKIVQIGLSSRNLQPGENDGILVDHRIAFDIIAVVVNPNVLVRNLTSAQLKGIFTGTITNWREVGGCDAGIVVIVRDQASGTREVFDEKALGSTKDKPVESLPSAIECASNGVVREIVASAKNAIGYLSYGFINDHIKPVKYNGAPPDIENAEAGRYPISRYLHMFTRGDPTGVVKGYIDFVLSAKFQDEVVALTYVRIRQTRKK